MSQSQQNASKRAGCDPEWVFKAHGMNGGPGSLDGSHGICKLKKENREEKTPPTTKKEPFLHQDYIFLNRHHLSAHKVFSRKNFSIQRHTARRREDTQVELCVLLTPSYMLLSHSSFLNVTLLPSVVLSFSKFCV